MSTRPIFVPVSKPGQLVVEVPVEFTWNKGFAPSQKKKNVAALHAAGAKRGLYPLLEISTKSDEPLGQRLSAFNLKVPFLELQTSFESAYQGSKVFFEGGPYTDLYERPPQEAKRDPRLRSSGRLIGFDFHGVSFPLEPKTAFYDWLYLSALYPFRDFLQDRLSVYRGFTDIEFNPERSINCQARSCAIFVSLQSRGILDECMDSYDLFEKLLSEDEHARLRGRISQVSARESAPG